MPNVNQVLLAGHVGGDPQVRQTTNSQVASFSMATNKNRKLSDGSWEKIPTWHRVVCWGWLAEVVAEQFRKGDGVIVYGRIETRSYTDRDGNEKTATEIVADDAYKVVPHPRKQGSTYAQPNRQEQRSFNDEEAPF